MGGIDLLDLYDSSADGMVKEHIHCCWYLCLGSFFNVIFTQGSGPTVQSLPKSCSKWAKTTKLRTQRILTKMSQCLFSVKLQIYMYIRRLGAQAVLCIYSIVVCVSCHAVKSSFYLILISVAHLRICFPPVAIFVVQITVLTLVHSLLLNY